MAARAQAGVLQRRELEGAGQHQDAGGDHPVVRLQPGTRIDQLRAAPRRPRTRATPNADQTSGVAAEERGQRPPAPRLRRRRRANIRISGRLDGSIIAAIITCHARRNSTSASPNARPALEQRVVMDRARHPARLGRDRATQAAAIAQQRSARGDRRGRRERDDGRRRSSAGLAR